MIDLSLPPDLLPDVRDDRVALCHGCFDVLHFGHINHLEAAARLADRLVVSITDDVYVGKPGRPIFSAAERMRMLAALSVVDHVLVVAAPDALPVISVLRPDVFVKGSDYRGPQSDRSPGAQFRAERDLVISYGGVVDYTSEDSFSTSEVLARLVGSPRHVG